MTNKDDRDTNIGSILTLSTIIEHVMGSASETQMTSLFYNCKAVILLRTSLVEMGYPQQKTTSITNNSTAEDLINKNMTPNRPKTYDFRTNWLKCREAQRRFNIMWKRDRTIERSIIPRTIHLMYTKKK